MNCALAALSGLLLYASDYPLHWWPLHFIAFVPFFIAVLRSNQSRPQPWRLGISFVIPYCLLMVVSAGDSAPVIAAAAVGLVQWLLVLRIVSWLLPIGPLLGPASAAGAVCLAELFVWHVVPVFGTAQCFARVTSALPQAIQFAAYTGLISVVFMLMVTQGLIANAVLGRGGRACIATLVAILAVLSLTNYVRWDRGIGGTCTVAAVAWGGKVESTLTDLCKLAKSRGASILVTPEMGFSVDSDKDGSTLSDLRNEVREQRIHAAVGAFQQDIRQNRIFFIEPDGKCITRYSKSHLIPFMESYGAGDGSVAILNWDGFKIGGMICQDDNFTDLSRAYGRAGVQLMLLPTFDWRPIRGYHFESSVVRAIESGYAIVRSAKNGISAIISPRGEIVASHDHTIESEPTCVSATCSVGDGVTTVYSQFGDWPIGVLSVMCIIAGTRAWQQSCREKRAR